MWKSVFEKYIGSWVAVWCVRYTYRGIVKHAGDDVLTLSDPKAVEISGSATAEAPSQEDPIPGDLHISYDAIECVCQPTWVDKVTKPVKK